MFSREFRLRTIVADAHGWSRNPFQSQAQLSAVRNSNCNAIVPSMLVSRSLKTLRICLLTVFIAIYAPSAWPQKKPAPADSAEQKTARYFESIRAQPLLLHAFLQEMPKGGDLHNHLSGAVYAESFIKFAVQDGLCIDHAALAFTQPPCDPASGKPPASVALQDSVLYSHLLDALSMRQFVAGAESGHDHFFSTFGKFGPATNAHTAEMLAEARSRAAAGHLQYLETMFNPDGGAAARLGASLGWNDDLSKFRELLLSGGLTKIVADAANFLTIRKKKNRKSSVVTSPSQIMAATLRLAICIRWRAACQKKWSLLRYSPALSSLPKTRASLASTWLCLKTHTCRFTTSICTCVCWIFFTAFIPKSTSHCTPAN